MTAQEWLERNGVWLKPHHVVVNSVHLIHFQDGRSMIKKGHRKERQWRFFENETLALDAFIEWADGK